MTRIPLLNEYIFPNSSYILSESTSIFNVDLSSLDANREELKVPGNVCPAEFE